MKKLLILLVFGFLWPASGNCLAQSPREGYITTAGGLRLFYKVLGSGAETLVAVHGGPGNSLTSILPDLEPLAKNRTVIYYDQRGNGRSSLTKDRQKLSICKHIADLEAVRAYFKLDKMTLLGNSWGGLLVSYYASAHPDRVERLILHSPAPPMRAFLSELEAEIESRIPLRLNADQVRRYRIMSNRLDWAKSKDPRARCREFFQLLFPTYVSRPESAKLLQGDVCSGSEEVVRNQMVVNMEIWNSLGDYDLVPSLSVVKAPVLVIHGADDPIPLKASEMWATAFPNARLLVIKDAGHMPQIEQPEIFFTAVETFLKGDFLEEAQKVQTSPAKDQVKRKNRQAHHRRSTPARLTQIFTGHGEPVIAT